MQVNGAAVDASIPCFIARPAYGGNNRPNGSSNVTYIPNGLTQPWGPYTSSVYIPAIVKSVSPAANGTQSLVEFQKVNSNVTYPNYLTQAFDNILSQYTTTYNLNSVPESGSLTYAVPVNGFVQDSNAIVACAGQ